MSLGVENSAESYAIFRCVDCECENIAWDGTPEHRKITEERILARKLGQCHNASCRCHTTGRNVRIQGKTIHVGKEPPWQN